MLGRQHFLFGFASSVSFAVLANQVNSSIIVSPAMFVAAAVFGSLFPDIDSENSMIGRKLTFISAYLEGRFGHRTIAHELFIMVPLFILSLFLRNTVFFGFMFGVMGHLLLDSFTKYGISVNYFKHRVAYSNGWDKDFNLGRFHIVPAFIYNHVSSNGIAANIITLALSAGVLYLANIIVIRMSGLNLISVMTTMAWFS